ncbi:MAG TPA: WbqC family protein [Pyrinomonadaceae bacterium]|nr:WbqC family protein [Pyrinomonadaceae bacterium]
MNCVILQPSYIPWRGFFHQIQKADLFIFYDDVQYDKHGWRNRNKIKTANGNIWLTIPVLSGGNVVYQTAINQIQISPSENWAKKHLLSLKYSYSKAPFFKDFFPFIEEVYETPSESLAEFTINTTIKLSRILGIEHTKFERSSNIPAQGQKSDRLLEILKNVGATHYISGPSAKDYIEDEKFQEAEISLEYINYNYPEYPQLYPPFDPQVSILDLLFMTGENAHKYIWGENSI